LIKQADGVYSEETVNCNAATDPVFSAAYCDVPLTVLRASPYSLTLGTLVQAKVKATNVIGDSAFSQENTAGATIETEPGVVNTLEMNILTSTNEQVVLEWALLSTLAETGGSTILNYVIRWN